MKHPNFTLIASLTIAVLTGCGGGGGSGETNAPVAGSGQPIVETAPTRPQSPTILVEAPGEPDISPTAPDTPSETVAVPVAMVPEKIEILTGGYTSISGLASTGIKDSALTYLWTLVTKPEASTFNFVDTMLPVVSIWADVEGTYKFKLVVSSGGKSSAPAYVNVEAIPTGLIAPFVTLKGSGFSMHDSPSVTGCQYYRSATNFKAFWSFASDVYNLNCPLVSTGTVPDLIGPSAFSGGGSFAYLGRSIASLPDSGASGSSTTTWASVNTLTGYTLGLSAEPILLAKVEPGKTTGSTFTHATNPATATPYTQGVVQYKLEGTFNNTNVPAGWELDQDMHVLVTLSGSTFENGQPSGATVKIFEKTFTTDFSETIPLSLNFNQLPVAFAEYASYRVSVVNRFAFRRITDD